MKPAWRFPAVERHLSEHLTLGCSAEGVESRREVSRQQDSTPPAPYRRGHGRTATTRRRAAEPRRLPERPPPRAASTSCSSTSRGDGEREVVDRAPTTLPAPLTDDLLGGHLEDVEGGAAAQVDDLHPGVIVAGRDLEGHRRLEGRCVERDRCVHVAGERGDMVETCGERHVGLLLVRWRQTVLRLKITVN